MFGIMRQFVQVPIRTRMARAASPNFAFFRRHKKRLFN
jgi:hypothetical protein